MRKLLIALHALLIATPVLPVYGWINYPSDLRERPLSPVEEGLKGEGAKLSVVAAGLPACLALLNLPFLFGRRPRWSALSSLGIGLVAAGLMAQLVARYGYGRQWGVWAIWGLSMALLIAAVAAWARLGAAPCPHCGKVTA